MVLEAAHETSTEPRPAEIAASRLLLDRASFAAIGPALRVSTWALRAAMVLASLETLFTFLAIFLLQLGAAKAPPLSHRHALYRTAQKRKQEKSASGGIQKLGLSIEFL